MLVWGSILDPGAELLLALENPFCKRKNYLVPFAFDPLHPRQLSFHITAVAEIVSISPSHCNVALAGIKNDSKLFRSVLRI